MTSHFDAEAFLRTYSTGFRHVIESRTKPLADMNAVPTMTRPPLRYHGGKWRLSPWIIGHFPPHRFYVEPYGGGAGVLFRKDRSFSEVYNDLASEIVNVFRVIREDRAELERLLRATPYARSEFAAAYESTDDPVEQARRTIIRSHMGFGSAAATRPHRTGFRSNATRSGSTPAHDWAKYPDLLASFEERLKGVVIEERDALACIRQHDTPETLFYVDPPYPLSTRGNVSDCYSIEMTDDDHRELAAVLCGVRGMVVLSGYACDLYDRELYADWHRVTKDTIGSGQKSSVSRTEVLWMNAAAVERLHGSSLFRAA